MNRRFSKRVISWPMSTWKGVQNHQPLGTWKSKSQWDTTFTLTRVIRIKKICSNKHWQKHGETGIFIHCWRDCKMEQLLQEKLSARTSKSEPQLPRDSAIHSQVYTRENQKHVMYTKPGMFTAALFTKSPSETERDKYHMISLLCGI